LWGPYFPTLGTGKVDSQDHLMSKAELSQWPVL